MFVPVHFFPSTGQRSVVQAEQPACLRPGLPGDGATHQLCPYPWAAGKHLEGVMALPLVIRQPCSPGVMAHEVGGGKKSGRCSKAPCGALERGLALSICLSPGGWQGVSLLQVPWLAMRIVSWLP